MTLALFGIGGPGEIGCGSSLNFKCAPNDNRVYDCSHY